MKEATRLEVQRAIWAGELGRALALLRGGDQAPHRAPAAVQVDEDELGLRCLAAGEVELAAFVLAKRDTDAGHLLRAREQLPTNVLQAVAKWMLGDLAEQGVYASVVHASPEETERIKAVARKLPFATPLRELPTVAWDPDAFSFKTFLVLVLIAVVGLFFWENCG
ncbi:MAG: hypothetical protein AAGE52_25550 [Myxococcota bacterium]